MTVAVIINPASGRRGGQPSGAEREALARRLLASSAATVELSRAAGHAADLARAAVARGVDRVVAWGGDGTINEVAGALIGTSSALGIVPAGSGDGLARSLGVPRASAEAFQLAISGTAVPTDVGMLANRHFLNVAGIGFDAFVGREFNRGGRRGALRYAALGLSRVWTYRCERYQIELDGRPLEPEPDGPRFLIGFANGREYGNAMVLSADADPRDGWLDAVIVEEGSPLRLMWRARRLTLGHGRPAEGIFRTRVRSARITGDTLVCHVDGETFEATGAIEVSLRPGALLVVGRG